MTTAIALPKGVSLLENGAQLPDNLSWDEWGDLLRGLKRVKSAYHHILGDVISFGRAKWPEHADEVVEQLEFELGDVQKADATSQFSLTKRRGLSSDHLHVITKESDPEERDRWADVALNEGLSPRELQHSIRNKRVVRQDEINQLSGRGSGFPTLSSVISAYTRWEKAVGGLEGVRSLGSHDRNHVVEELEPIWRLVEELGHA